MKQKHLFMAGIPSIVMLSVVPVFTLILAACPLDNDEDDDLFNAPGLIDWPLPSKIGNNEVGGKAWLTSYMRVAHSNDGTYTKFIPVYGTPSETGIYSWNETDRKITYKMEKTLYKNSLTNSTGTELLNIREYRQAMRNDFEEYKTKSPQPYDWILIFIGGIDNLEGFINGLVNNDFSAKYSDYSLSGNGVSLLMQESLPANVPPDELSGYNYRSANTEFPYIFGTDGTYTFKGDDWQGHDREITGKFAYNGGQWNKMVYLLPLTVDGKIALEWYDEVEVPGPHEFADDDEYKAAQTNTTFMMIGHEYDPTVRTIGK
jgi:hypothetical protein